MEQTRKKKRKLLERFLRETTKNDKTILESPDAIFAIDFNGYFIFLNQACTSLTGYTAEEATTLSYLKLVSLKDIDKAYHHFQKTVEGHTQSFDCEIIHKEGRSIKMQVTNSPIIINGEFVGVYGMASKL